MLRRLSPLLAAAALSVSSFTAQAATHYPLTVHNCGRDLVFEHAPQRVVSIGQASTELLLSLGVGPRLVGTGVWFGALPANLQAEGKGIPRLADNAPSFEAVVGTRPITSVPAARWATSRASPTWVSPPTWRPATARARR